MREECSSFAEKLTGLFSDIIVKTMNVQLLRDLEEMGITISQLQALSLVAERRSHSVGELAERLGVTHPAAVKLTQRLRDKGLIERAVSETDHRQAVLSATSAGYDLVNRIRCERAQRLSRILDRMGAADRLAMMRGLESFVTAALQDEGALDGLCWSCQTLLPTDCKDFAALARRQMLVLSRDSG
jgi:DNA-binding MarR family transcriptional regulator